MRRGRADHRSVSTFTTRLDKVVDALGATAHGLGWALYLAECVMSALAVLAGVVVAARWTPWGWSLAALAAGWLVGLLRHWWKPLVYGPVFYWSWY